MRRTIVFHLVFLLMLGVVLAHGGNTGVDLQWRPIPGVDAGPVQTTPKASFANATWVEPVTGMEFTWVPGGCYEMGCGSWTSECENDEMPVHEVCVDGFWMGKTEVTQGQWQTVMGNNPSHFKKGDQYPVEEISWEESKDFITRLNQISGGKTFRLPTEAEWEYACRNAGRNVKYPWGSELGRNRANCDGCGTQWDKKSTAPVASFPPNDLGLHDMAGNVREWCEDVRVLLPYISHSRTNPVATINRGRNLWRGNRSVSENDIWHVWRGGHYRAQGGRVRCGARPAPQIVLGGETGFRLVGN